jgi:hypothetical protein
VADVARREGRRRGEVVRREEEARVGELAARGVDREGRHVREEAREERELVAVPRGAVLAVREDGRGVRPPHRLDLVPEDEAAHARAARARGRVPALRGEADKVPPVLERVPGEAAGGLGRPRAPGEASAAGGLRPGRGCLDDERGHRPDARVARQRVVEAREEPVLVLAVEARLAARGAVRLVRGDGEEAVRAARGEGSRRGGRGLRGAPEEILAANRGREERRLRCLALGEDGGPLRRVRPPRHHLVVDALQPREGRERRRRRRRRRADVRRARRQRARRRCKRARGECSSCCCEQRGGARGARARHDLFGGGRELQSHPGSSLSVD